MRPSLHDQSRRRAGGLAGAARLEAELQLRPEEAGTPLRHRPASAAPETKTHNGSFVRKETFISCTLQGASVTKLFFKTSTHISNIFVPEVTHPPENELEMPRKELLLRNLSFCSAHSQAKSTEVGKGAMPGAKLLQKVLFKDKELVQKKNYC